MLESRLKRFTGMQTHQNEGIEFAERTYWEVKEDNLSLNPKMTGEALEVRSDNTKPRILLILLSRLDE